MCFLTAHHATGARESEEVMEVREVWRKAHLKQRWRGYRTRQLGGSGLKSTTGAPTRGGSSGMDRAQPERRETRIPKCKKLGAKPPNGLFWADKQSHGLAHITRPSPIAVGDHRSALRTRDARSKIVHDIMI